MKAGIQYLFFLVFFLSLQVLAQPRKELVTVIVMPNHVDWVYDVGERAEFSILVLKNNTPMDGIKIDYTLGPEFMDIWDSGTLTLKNGIVRVKAKKFNQPGFLRCMATVQIDGKKYSSFATAGFSPNKIEPTTTLPSDFEEFWNKGKEELSKVSMKPVLTLMPERCTDKVDVYHVKLDNIKGKVYGVLCRPKKEGKYPAILHFPSAGVKPQYGDVREAEAGFITFAIGIHGIPVNLDKAVYEDLKDGALDKYWTINLDDKDNAYYRRVYLGCVRAVDFIESLDYFDGEHIGVTGASQGGGLSMVTAGLDDRIDYLAVFYPALADITGFLHGRAGGWPRIFNDDFTNKPEKVESSKYFDVVNFAQFIKIPGWYSWGYNDPICPPTSMYAAYNIIKAKKELLIVPDTKHYAYPEQLELKERWLFGKLLNE